MCVCFCVCDTLTCVYPNRRCTAWCPGWWRPSQDRILHSRSTAGFQRWTGCPPVPCSHHSPDLRLHLLLPHRLLKLLTLSCSAVSGNHTHEQEWGVVSPSQGKCHRCILAIPELTLSYTVEHMAWSPTFNAGTFSETKLVKPFIWSIKATTLSSFCTFLPYI